MTEEEQLESMKKWWKRYGNLVTITASIVLLSFAGFRYYQWHQLKITQQASIAYEKMIMEFSNQNIKGVRSYANELVHNYANSVYADAAHLTLAKIYVNKNKLDRAKKELQFVANKSKMPPLKQLAKIRIAKLLVADKSYDNALKELSSVEDTTYLPVINELKGDIYGAIGQYQEAVKAYKLALAEVKNNGMGNLYLEMKTNELSNRDHSMRADDKTVQST